MFVQLIRLKENFGKGKKKKYVQGYSATQSVTIISLQSNIGIEIQI